MSDVLLDLPSHLRDRLVSALESGLLGPSSRCSPFNSPKPGSGRTRDPKLPEFNQRRGDVFRILSVPQHRAKREWESVFYDPRALDPEGPGGVLHAKVVVADDEVAFITSANLTKAALDRNIELGVLIRDRAFVLAIGGYFRSLSERDLLKPLPLA
jgi:phosphatidylserine/phosphatidylglycerophosphate/cardiolipin synthase-like enzyme